MKEMHSQYRNLKCGINRRPSFLAPIHVNLWECSDDLCATWNSHVVGQLGLAEGAISGNSYTFIPCRVVDLNDVKFGLSSATITSWAAPSCERSMQISFQKLKAKLHEINPSVHFSKSFIFVAEATALASPAPVHRGRTPYDMAKHEGEQKVMDLLHPVPRWKAVEEWGSKNVCNLWLESMAKR